VRLFFVIRAEHHRRVTHRIVGEPVDKQMNLQQQRHKDCGGTFQVFAAASSIAKSEFAAIICNPNGLLRRAATASILVASFNCSPPMKKQLARLAVWGNG
jgi:hypothetical protein